jgi:hypothetical protein
MVRNLLLNPLPLSDKRLRFLCALEYALQVYQFYEAIIRNFGNAVATLYPHYSTW